MASPCWGRSVSEAYHRTCVLVGEIKRNIIVEMLCAQNGKTPEYISDEELAYMATHGDAVMYPALVKKKASARGQAGAGPVRLPALLAPVPDLGECASL